MGWYNTRTNPTVNILRFLVNKMLQMVFKMTTSFKALPFFSYEEKKKSFVNCFYLEHKELLTL